MEKHVFIEKAMIQISENPMDRVSERVKKLLEKDETFIDSHLHIFDRHCVPIPYFNLRFKTISGIEGSLEKILKNNNEYTTDFLNFLNILGLSSMKKVLDYLYKKFYNVNETIVTPLMMDLDYAWQRKSRKSVSRQIAEMKNLIPNYPILPFFAVDPRRVHCNDKQKDLYYYFLKAFSNANPFFGVKVYPATGYLPSDSRLLPIYEICEKKNIPITTHCGGEIISTTINPVECNGLQDDLTPFNCSINGSYFKKARFFNEPKLWEPVLKKYPKLKLNFGHFGGGREWKNITKSNRLSIIFRLMNEYPNVYGDISVLITENSIKNTLTKKMKTNSIVFNRTIHGTDFHVILAGKDLGKGLKRYRNEFDYWDQISKINPKRFLFDMS